MWYACLPLRPLAHSRRPLIPSSPALPPGERVVDGMPDAGELANSAAGRATVGPVPLQRGVSGVRRFVSFRRKLTRRRMALVGEEEDIDHRKSTQEEDSKKVGARASAGRGACR